MTDYQIDARLMTAAVRARDRDYRQGVAEAHAMLLDIVIPPAHPWTLKGAPRRTAPVAREWRRYPRAVTEL
jgi:hypothetical protein